MEDTLVRAQDQIRAHESRPPPSSAAMMPPTRDLTLQIEDDDSEKEPMIQAYQAGHELSEL